MTHITHRILKYRDSARQLYNNYFLCVDWKDSEYYSDEYFEEINEILLQKTVLNQIDSQAPLLKNDDDVYEHIKVIPNYGPLGFQTMFAPANRQFTEWKILQLKTTGNDFRFLSFFDWTTEKTMEMQYSRVRLIHSEEFPELIGYDFLLESWNSEFYFVENLEPIL